MANLTLQDIRNKMNRSRRTVLNDATALRQQKLIRFCNDNDAFNWACRHYRYNYEAYHGNMPAITSDYYSDMLWLITDKENYRYALENLEEDPLTKESEYLIKGLKALRKKYA